MEPDIPSEWFLPKQEMCKVTVPAIVKEKIKKNSLTYQSLKK